MKCRLPVTALLAGITLFAQTKPARLEFEVASVRPSPAQMPNQAAVGLKIDGAQIRATFMPLREYLAMAYRVRPNQIVGPEWIASERFDITAKLPAGAKTDQFADMLQSLLEDRFHLKARRDKKEFPVYGLVAAKGGLKIQPLPPDPDETDPGILDLKASGSASGVQIDFGGNSSFALGNNRLEVKRLRMADFAEALTRFADRVVVDMTDVTGKFDFNVEMTPEDYRSILIRSAVNAGVTLPPQALQLLEGFSGESTFLALQTVGLKLESRKAPLDVLIVESVSKTPTAN